MELAVLRKNDFPAELRVAWQENVNELIIEKMRYTTDVIDGIVVRVPVGQLHSKLRYMRIKRAQRIAVMICELELRLENIVYDINNSACQD